MKLPMKAQIEVQNLSEFKDFIHLEVLPAIQPRTLFLLEGEVGAGKTELVKIVCAALGLRDVQSPTFAFHQTYTSEKQTLHHVDLYRLKSEEDLESTGFWDLFEDEGSTLFIEWSNLIQSEAWPWGWKIVRLQIQKIASKPSARLIFIEL